jgi:hypothetical protein
MSEMSFGDAMHSFLNKSKRIKRGVQSHQITDVWETLMGKTIARYTDQLQIVNKTLFITTSVAPLRQELNFQKDSIIKRVNELLGEDSIAEVVVR